MGVSARTRPFFRLKLFTAATDECVVNLNYDKIKSKVEHGGNHWTSYSDLFLVLSVVFLLLYVVANLRSGTVSFAQYRQIQEAKQEVAEAKQQVKAYEILKQDYLKNGASGDEIKMYQELMGKLSLLEGEAKQERDSMYRQAKEAQEKEESLNRYQQMVKGIISANLVASQRLKKRDEAIVQRDQAIMERNYEIDDLTRSVQMKEAVIDQNNQTIAGIESKLDKEIQAVQEAYRGRQQDKAVADAKIAELKADSGKKIDALRHENDQYMTQLQSAQQSILEKNRRVRAVDVPAERSRRQVPASNLGARPRSRAGAGAVKRPHLKTASEAARSRWKASSRRNRNTKRPSRLRTKLTTIS